MSLVEAAVNLDNNSIFWSTTMTFAEAREFCNTRKVVYTDVLADVVAALEDIMKHTYSIFTMGREYARCIYLKWYITDKTAKSVALLETLSSEFDITTDSNTGWATLRMCWC